jgi:hypothetical protein
VLYNEAPAVVSNSYVPLSTLGLTPLPPERPHMFSQAAAVVESPNLWSDTGSTPGALPPRPDRSALSESIPLFYIGRNRNGFWVVRSADGRIGGLFVFRRSAIRFAREESEPAACALMFVTEPLELT